VRKSLKLNGLRVKFFLKFFCVKQKDFLQKTRFPLDGWRFYGSISSMKNVIEKQNYELLFQLATVKVMCEVWSKEGSFSVESIRHRLREKAEELQKFIDSLPKPTTNN